MEFLKNDHGKLKNALTEFLLSVWDCGIPKVGSKV